VGFHFLGKIHLEFFCEQLQQCLDVRLGLAFQFAFDLASGSALNLALGPALLFSDPFDAADLRHHLLLFKLGQVDTQRLILPEDPLTSQGT
jgi:hypothetical protein